MSAEAGHVSRGQGSYAALMNGPKLKLQIWSHFILLVGQSTLSNLIKRQLRFKN